MKKLLASPRFLSSPRCQVLLSYVVEESVNGSTESLKERNIGVRIFKRDPGYDTNADPVVRVAISEIRKKLAQYYYDPANLDEVRIEVPIGSYVPVFSTPEGAFGKLAILPVDEDAHAGAVAVEPELAPQKHSVARPRIRHWVPATAAAVCIALAVAAGWAWRIAQTKSPLDLFWNPVVKSSNPALLCIGQLRATSVLLDPDVSRNPGAPTMAIGPAGVYPIQMPVAVLDDSITTANIAGVLRYEKKDFSVLPEGNTNYDDLQKGPVVLIGALNNDWTMHLMRSMRYQFNDDGQTTEWWVSDQKNPGVKMGVYKANSGATITHDLAIVARVFDAETKQPTIIVAGLTPPGTLAAGDFVTNPRYLAEFIRSAPRDWQKKNIELLLGINVIDGQPGPPHVSGISVW
ncbi:MAG TPA: hypothetical protein VL986_03565 [Terracidiphilus sp.]|nr:hypothetical protein [Terracidiphilus sp.]